jgi:predicted enzyme related to lactoylglutathione lyase
MNRDPLDALREPVVPVAPDPVFAAALRARLERAVLGPVARRPGARQSTEGEAMSGQSGTSAAVTMPSVPTVEGDVAYASLCIGDLDRAIAFYGALLGWRLEPGSTERGRQVPGGHPPMGLWGGTDHNTLFLCHAVDDIAAAVARVRDAGGRADEPEMRPYGLIADCADDQGMPFALLGAPAADRVAHAPTGVGDLLYLTVETPDTARFRAFYGAVFGWRFTPGRVEDGWNVADVRPMTGLHGGQTRPTVVPMYGVPDVAAAVATVRANGGTATDPAQQSYGVTADCADDQGTRFYLGQI